MLSPSALLPFAENWLLYPIITWDGYSGGASGADNGDCHALSGVPACGHFLMLVLGAVTHPGGCSASIAKAKRALIHFFILRITIWHLHIKQEDSGANIWMGVSDVLCCSDALISTEATLQEAWTPIAAEP